MSSCDARAWEIYLNRGLDFMTEYWICSCGELNKMKDEYCKCGRRYDPKKDKVTVVK